MFITHMWKKFINANILIIKTLQIRASDKRTLTDKENQRLIFNIIYRFDQNSVYYYIYYPKIT